jgi:hypothetical protein
MHSLFTCHHSQVWMSVSGSPTCLIIMMTWSEWC